MSFPPNLGITNSLIIDSDYNCLIFHEFPSLLSPLKQISSPFSKAKMHNGYSKISTTKRSKSIDFADLSSQHHKAGSTPNYLTNSRFKPNTARRITTMRSSISEHETEEGDAFGHILSRKRSISSLNSDRTAVDEQEVAKGSFSIRISSASVYESYSRFHHQCGLNAELDDDDQYESGFITQKKCVKKKGKFFGAFRRLFGL